MSQWMEMLKEIDRLQEDTALTVCPGRVAYLERCMEDEEALRPKIDLRIE